MTNETDLKNARRVLITEGYDVDQYKTPEETIDAYHRLIMQQSLESMNSNASVDASVDAALSVAPVEPSRREVLTQYYDDDINAQAAERILTAGMKGGLPDAAVMVSEILQDNLNQFVGEIRAEYESEKDDAVKAAVENERLNAPAQKVERVITRTITLDANGAQVIPLINPQAIPAKTAAELWPEQLGTVAHLNADYTFPCADFDAGTPRYHNVVTLHTQGLLRVIANAFTLGQNIWLKGESGTGKSTLCEHVAAVTGRPFTRISHHEGTETGELVGGNTLKDGNVIWQDGAFTRACRIPNMLILIDEPTLSYKACQLYQTVCDERRITIDTTGEVVYLAEGVTIICADNTGGHGDDTGRFDGTAPVNVAFLERFAVIIPVDYMTEKDEIKALRHSTGVSERLAKPIVQFAQLTRRAADIEQPITFRRVLAFTELLRDGTPQALAFDLTILGHLRSSQDREAVQNLAIAQLAQNLNNV